MPTSKLISSLYLMSLILHFPYVFEASPRFYMCPRSGYFTSNDTYETNLKMLMGYLSHRTPRTGSSFTSMGKDQYTIYGLALCRGSLSHVGCADCVSEARSQARSCCSNNKAATLWYDNCLFKYSNENFFGQLDLENVFFVADSGNETVAVSLVKANKLLRELAKKASKRPQMYATGNVKVDESRTLHGLVQCTRDLSRNNCTKCLDKLLKLQVQEQPSYCLEKEGSCKVFTSSCFVGYATSVVKTKRKNMTAAFTN
ncbi:Cysteine-rich repeat secretory protein 38 [Morella rubra]|uniref:Cysteine-rich repeat secretory protein 38 n=1 Tax=Morella rubra TaxID=262757 RepID=A0A6A1UMW4_9ROSI|nr:Cysteine-rich repeat secretory protein 38 [Morella rubra]